LYAVIGKETTLRVAAEENKMSFLDVCALAIVRLAIDASSEHETKFPAAGECERLRFLFS
jgi:hypothetical protein